MQGQVIEIDNNIPVVHRGNTYQGRIVEIKGSAYKVQYYIPTGVDTYETRIKWMGEGAKVAATLDTAKRKKGVIKLVAGMLSGASVLFFFNPEVRTLIELLQTALEALSGSI